MSPKSPVCLLFFATLFVYAYFFQGFGFNQNAQYDAVRAIVESGKLAIGDYAAFGSVGYTEDVSRAGDRIYSSKPPGVVLFVAPFYAALYFPERWCGVDTSNDQVVARNQYLCTIWGAGLPGAVLAVAMFRFFCRRGSSESDALVLAAGFAFGSLILPYSGMLMSAVLTAACLFVAWRLVDDEPAPQRALAAGMLVGLAALADTSAAPLVLAYFVLLWIHQRRSIPAFLAGPALAAAVTLAYQRAIFGSALTWSYSHVEPHYLGQGMFLKHLHAPDLRRLYWLSFHPLRGLFYCCPIFLLSVLSAVTAKWSRAALARSWFPLCVILNFLLFNLMFHAWTAGWGVGPRYLVPALPFLFTFAAAAHVRFRRLSYVLIALSVVCMLAVTAVRAQFPANLYGPPVLRDASDDPVAECLKRLTMNQLARTEGSSNLGLRIGMKGDWSLLPPVAVIAGVFAFARRLRLSSPPSSGA